MRQKPGGFQFHSIALAQSRAGEAVHRASRIDRVENENVRQHAFDGTRIDVGLIRNIAALAQAAPVTNQKMGILVLHRTLAPMTCAGGDPDRNAATRLGSQESESYAN